MKKFILVFYVLLGLIVTSCNKTMEIVEENNIVNAGLSFETYGFQTVNTYTLYDEYEYNLKINYRDTEQIDVSIKEDASALVDYNDLYEKKYSLLSFEYYTISENITISDTETTIPVVFNVKKIIDEIGQKEAANYVVPLLVQSTVDGVAINKTGGGVILHVLVNEPVIEFSQNALEVTIDDTTSVSMLNMIGNFGFDGFDISNVSAKVNLDKVSTYNSINGTDYKELPSLNYTFNELSVDLASGSLSSGIQVNAIGLEVESTYILPVDLSSNLYTSEPETIYYIITINPTAPEYEEVIELSTLQIVTSEYETTQVSFDFAKVASLLNTTEGELRENIVLYGINTDELSFSKDYTAGAPGFWFNSDRNVGGYSSDNSMMFVEYREEGKFHIGQFPDKAVAGEQKKVSLAMVYNGLMVRFNISLFITYGNYDLTASGPVNETYTGIPVEFDIDAAATAFGVTTSELKGNMDLYALSAGSISKTSTATDPGFWFNDEGDVCNWGTEGCAIFVTYDNNKTFNAGQFPGFTKSGDVYNYTLILVYNKTNFITYNITVNIT